MNAPLNTWAPCPLCSGRGHFDGSSMECMTCEGLGRIEIPPVPVVEGWSLSSVFDALGIATDMEIEDIGQ